jgi:hypothetical protein
MLNPEKPVVILIGKNNLCDEEKAFLELLVFQTNIGGESALLNPSINGKNTTLTNIIAMGQNANLEASSLQRIGIISADPYRRILKETYKDWLDRIDDLHGAICNCYKIIATTREAYLSLVFKHQQTIYYVPFPPTVKLKCITKEKNNKLVLIKSKNSKIPNEILNYFKKMNHDYLELSYSQNEYLTPFALQEILQSKELFWVGDLNLRYENIDINPISLSMASNIVHVNDLSSYGSVTGLTFNECVRIRSTKSKTIKTSLAQQMGKQYLYHPNYSVLTSIKKHLI